jgi:hypothetical protein
MKPNFIHQLAKQYTLNRKLSTRIGIQSHNALISREIWGVLEHEPTGVAIAVGNGRWQAIGFEDVANNGLD